MREDGRIRFAKEIKDRVDGLRDAVRSVKGELLGKGMRGCAPGMEGDINAAVRWAHARLRHHQTYAGYPRPPRELQGCHRVGSHLVSPRSASPGGTDGLNGTPLFAGSHPRSSSGLSRLTMPPRRLLG